MATNGVATLRGSVMLKLVVGCDGHNLTERILELLLEGNLKEEDLLLFLADQNLGCKKCRQVIPNLTSAERFSNPHRQFTCHETITVDLATRKIELSSTSKIASEIWNSWEKTLKGLGKELRDKEWEIFIIDLPETNSLAEERASDLGACWLDHR